MRLAMQQEFAEQISVIRRSIEAISGLPGWTHGSPFAFAFTSASTSTLAIAITITKSELRDKWTVLVLPIRAGGPPM